MTLSNMNTTVVETVFNEKMYKKNITKIYENIPIRELQEKLKPIITKLENLLLEPITNPKQIIVVKQLSIEL